ncbi:hypothetical protein FOZ60_013467 [Perkinsus olseni]|uniref:Uncharacterized protein n=1 Tax=Perkinsus olseni TaxID=32597 RepID=A0A7J6N983_PEROL|nr:hypothetical protein FOZ60_013467 [Perkinsus olseni]
MPELRLFHLPTGPAKSVSTPTVDRYVPYVWVPNPPATLSAWFTAQSDGAERSSISPFTRTGGGSCPTRDYYEDPSLVLGEEGFLPMDTLKEWFKRHGRPSHGHLRFVQRDADKAARERKLRLMRTQSAFIERRVKKSRLLLSSSEAHYHALKKAK